MQASDDPRDDGNATSPTSEALKGQLATPALSPISEHGRRTKRRSSGYFAEEDAMQKKSELNGSAHVGEKTTGVVAKTSDDPGHRRRKSNASISPRLSVSDVGRTMKLSPKQIEELTSSPGSLPLCPITPGEDIPPLANGLDDAKEGSRQLLQSNGLIRKRGLSELGSVPFPDLNGSTGKTMPRIAAINATPGALTSARPVKALRSASSPIVQRKTSSSRLTKSRVQVPPLKIEDAHSATPNGSTNGPPKPSPTRDRSQTSPNPSAIPVPPLSLPTYLQLELSSSRPSALYIHRPPGSDFPYESSKVKFERLVNFLLLPPQLEQVLCFGALACLDSWLYTFTILPLRFIKAVIILLQWCGQSVVKEAHDLGTFVYEGVGRLWQRRKQGSTATSRRTSIAESERSRRPSMLDGMQEATPRMNAQALSSALKEKPRKKSGFRHRRRRSTPSALLPNHKADILQGLLIVTSCTVLMWFDASRMYHSIRGQAAIKLYVIYNVLEVFDRLFSALGQDVLECLFSKETLERNPDGRSKIIRPLWMFVLALVYNVIHSTALFYQVVTLNVAVNSYSNALLTLLMSNQFVEIKGTVFKKFEKENLFQITCADVVERFQLWLMLLVIALRNIVEVGGLSISLSSAFTAPSSTTASAGANATILSFKASSIIPKAFTLFPRWTGEVLGPFLIVLGSEMLVDWFKHAYITKFNNVKPNIYGRFLDVLAKDYYSHAFAEQNLTKRLGLPVIPLSCLFIRASVQTYHMFLATHMPMPMPSAATAVSLDHESTTTSPATMKALEQIDQIFRRALGRSTFGAGGESSDGFLSSWSLDDMIALATMTFFFLALYLVLLALKLILGMLLLSFARGRYSGMMERERQSTDARGKRVGGWGVVEVGEERRKWIYEDDPDALTQLREKEAKARAKADKGEVSLDGIDRYMMAAKRIW